MSETWYVYRYGLSQDLPLLKAAETELVLTPEGSNWRARFDLTQLSTDVEMIADPTTNGWYGAVEKVHFGFSRIVMPGGKTLLVGQIFHEKAVDMWREFFVAVPSRRTIPLSRQNQPYHFAECLLTPFQREKLPAWTNLSLLLNEENGGSIQIGQDITYTIDSTGVETYNGGLKVMGWNGNQSLEIWLLPNDATGGLLATGCHSHWPRGTGSGPWPFEPGGEHSRPHDPDCVKGLTWIPSPSGSSGTQSM